MARHSKLYSHQSGLCYICGEKMLTLADCEQGDPLQRTLDHIVPSAWGGKSVSENLVYTHNKCNGIKSHSLPSPLHPWQAQMVQRGFVQREFCRRWVGLANTGAFGTVPQLRRKYMRWWFMEAPDDRRMYDLKAFALGEGESRRDFLKRHRLQKSQWQGAPAAVSARMDIRHRRSGTGG